jgi:dolichol-phosphate mannosyltransferase
VLPAFNEAKNLPLLIPELISLIDRKYDYEIVIVDDGSSDDTAAVLASLTAENPFIKALSFYRNFGHQSALLAGLEIATGDAVITMDADFQHPPKEVSALIKYWEDGHDLIICQKNGDSSSPLVSIARKLGYSIYKMLGESKIIPGVSDFRLMDRVVCDYLLKCTEQRAVLRGLVMIPAKNFKIHKYNVADRKYGKSGYSLQKLYHLYVYTIVSFSTAPLKLASFFGSLLLLFSITYGSFILIEKVFNGAKIIQGWTALTLVVLAFFGFLFIYLGVLAEYISAIYDEVKMRPKYIIAKKYNC